MFHQLNSTTVFKEPPSNPKVKVCSLYPTCQEHLLHSIKYLYIPRTLRGFYRYRWTIGLTKNLISFARLDWIYMYRSIRIMTVLLLQLCTVNLGNTMSFPIHLHVLYYPWSKINLETYLPSCTNVLTISKLGTQMRKVSLTQAMRIFRRCQKPRSTAFNVALYPVCQVQG